MDEAEQRARAAVGCVEQDAAPRQDERSIERLRAILDPAEEVIHAMRPAQLNVCVSALRIELGRLLRQAPRLGIPVLREAHEVRLAAQDMIVGGQRLRAQAQGALAARGVDPVAERGGDGAHDIVLQGQHIDGIAVIAVGPQVIAALGLDELCGDPQAVADAAHAALDQVADGEFAADARDVEVAAAILEGRVARDDEQRAEARQLGDDVLGDTVAEVPLLRIVAQVENGSTAIEACSAASAACPAAGSLSSAAIGAARWRMRSYSAVVAGSGCTPISR